MAGWVESRSCSWFDFEWLFEIVGLPVALAWHARLEQSSGAPRAQDGGVLAEMIVVGVGDERFGNRFSSIEMPVDLRKVYPVSPLDLPAHVEALDSFAIEADSSWTDEYEREQC